MASRLWHALTFVTCARAAAVFELRRSSAGLSDEMPLLQVARDVPQALEMVRARLNSSMELSMTFEKLAAKLPEGPTKELLTRLKTCTSCSDWRRLGEDDDGGYLVCMDGLLEGKLRAAYSMGVEWHDKFSDDIYDLLRVPVHQFDCTVSQGANPCGDCHFHKVCVSGQYGGGSHPEGPNMNMQQILEYTGQESAPDDSLIMKMDVEGAEWPIYAEGQSGMSKFKQLIFEFHDLWKEKDHPRYALALKNIEEAGFRVAHIHGNNFGPVIDGKWGPEMYEIDGYRVPTVLEVTFVKNNPVFNVCETDQHLHPLDADNTKLKPSLPMAHLPE